MKMQFYLIIITALLSWTCKDTNKFSAEKEILSFAISGQESPSIIQSEEAKVSQIVDSTLNLTNIAPQITVSDKATISPVSGAEVDFSKGSVIYTVTAEDKTTKKWEVSVGTKKSDDAKILSFVINRKQLGDAIIEDTTVSVIIKYGLELTSLAPEIEVSANASISPASGESVDFSGGPVIYTVTAESGLTQEWVVNATSEIIYEGNILEYSVPNQVGETIFEDWNVYVEVPVGTDLSSIVPTITVTDGASIEPGSGVAVDFSQTGYVDYVVTMENGGKKNWRVFLAEEVIKPNHAYIQYMGRINYSNPLKPRLHSSAATIKTKFKGTFCEIILEDQNRWGSYNNYIEIIVDDNAPVRIQLSAGINNLDVVSGLTDGEHTLMITKDTESDIGYVDFIGFRCDALLKPDALPTRKIEFIGNSITCGYGAVADAADCQGQWYDNHNAYHAYGPIVARTLNAQWMLSSVSGIGLIHSCCDKGYEMPDVYDKVDFSTGGAAWDFNLYQSDIITICLGQNDGVQDSAAFVSAYIDFIGTIRSNNSTAEIICLTSPMADNTLFAAQEKYLTGVVDYMTGQGDAKVHKLYVSKGLINGCDAHPNKAEHQTVADEIIQFIDDNITW